MTERCAVGCAAGFSGDRTDAAAPVVDTLIAPRRPGGADLRDAGRAHAGAGAARAARRSRGRLRAAARRAARAGARALPASTASASSATSAPPTRAAPRCASAQLARELGLRAPRIAVVERRRPVGAGAPRRCCARARRAPADGMRDRQRQRLPRRRAIAEALRAGAEIVVTGRVADPSLAVGPALAHFGWARRRLGPPRARDDGRPPARMRRAGHRRLLRRSRATRTCPASRSVGFPIAEIDADGTASSPRPTAPAAASTSTPSRSSCSTRCTIRRPT